MEEKKQCKLCFKVFANGKALGGHMRSHLRMLPLPDKTQMTQLGAPTESASTLSSSAEDDDDDGREIENKGLVYCLRENPKRSFRLVDPEFLDLGSVVLFQTTESPVNPTRKLRSKRNRKVGSPGRDGLGKPKLLNPSLSPSPAESLAELSSVSDASPEEDSALSLMMLSRDTRFDSGEFMASHRCDICGRVFGSGQAMGGHKRSHFLADCSGSSAMDRDCLAHLKPAKKLKSLRSLIDLNLPAPLEDDDDEDHQ